MKRKLQTVKVDRFINLINIQKKKLNTWNQIMNVFDTMQYDVNTLLQM